MKSKTLFILLAAITVLSMVLAACGGGAATTEAPPEPTEAMPAEPPTEAPPTEAPPTEVPPTEEPAAPAFEGMTMAAPDCDYGGLFKSMEAVDELTVKFTMCAPDPAFPSKIAFSSFSIQPSEYLEATGGGGEGSDLLTTPIGTGPFVVKDWKRGEELVLERNENYWGEAPATQTLVFRWSAEAAQRLLELQAGTVDGIDNPGPDDFATIEADSNLQLKERPALNVFYVGMNNTYPPFDNEQVRQAIAWALTANASLITSTRLVPKSPPISPPAPSRTAVRARNGTHSILSRPKKC